MIINDNVAKLIEQGQSATIAEKSCKIGEVYKNYLELKAELKRIDEYIRLAKRRAVIGEFN